MGRIGVLEKAGVHGGPRTAPGPIAEQRRAIARIDEQIRALQAERRPLQVALERDENICRVWSNAVLACSRSEREDLSALGKRVRGAALDRLCEQMEEEGVTKADIDRLFPPAEEIRDGN